MSADVIIRKQKIRIRTNSERLAFECKQFVIERLNDELTKMYERVFYQKSPSDDHVLIDSLRIDLGVVSPTEFKKDIISLIEQKLIVELKKQFEDSQQDDFNDEQRFSQTSPIQFATERQQRRSALLYFLENGSYPWWYKKQERKNPSELLAQLDGDEQESFFLEVINKGKTLPLQSVEQFVKRLINYLEPAVCESYIYQISSLYSDNAIPLNINSILSQKEQFIRLFNITLKAFYEQVLGFILLNPFEKRFLESFIKRLSVVFPASMDELKSRAKLGMDEILFDITDRVVLEEFEKSKSNSTQADSSERISKGNIRRLDEEGLYIENAGIILLHPFLPAFFKGLQLVNNEDQFISEEARWKAAVLLYYLQCSDVEYKEWEMPLNKVLCGMAPSDIIQSGIQISEEEKKESELLLQTVVDYWDALKGSSVEALQNTFILREGKLSYKESYWLIQIERSGVDILLERLPWGIGTIKLPWLRQLIYTEW